MSNDSFDEPRCRALVRFAFLHTVTSSRTAEQRYVSRVETTARGALKISQPILKARTESSSFAKRCCVPFCEVFFWDHMLYFINNIYSSTFLRRTYSFSFFLFHSPGCNILTFNFTPTFPSFS